MEVSETEPREAIVGRDRHGYEYIHFPQLLVRDVRLYRRRPWRAPDEWNAPPSPPDSPPRLVPAGQKWTKTRLRKLQRRLKELRNQHVSAAPRAVAARHACLRPATPSGSEEEGQSGSGEEEEEEGEEPEPAVDLGDAGGRQDDDWKAPWRLSSGRGRGKGWRKGVRRAKSKGKGSAASSATVPPIRIVTLSKPKTDGTATPSKQKTSRTATPGKQKTSRTATPGKHKNAETAQPDRPRIVLKLSVPADEVSLLIQQVLIYYREYLDQIKNTSRNLLHPADFSHACTVAA